MISSDFEIPSYDSYIVNNTVHQIWTNLSFFWWQRLILTKVHSLNQNLVSIFSPTPTVLQLLLFFRAGHLRTFWPKTVGHNWFELEIFFVQIEMSEWESHFILFWVLNNVIFQFYSNSSTRTSNFLIQLLGYILFCQ